LPMAHSFLFSDESKFEKAIFEFVDQFAETS